MSKVSFFLFRLDVRHIFLSYWSVIVAGIGLIDAIAMHYRPIDAVGKTVLVSSPFLSLRFSVSASDITSDELPVDGGMAIKLG
ncbi:hypothetical protein [Erwinia sp.]|uniref:hypothetical protein n=1 Tax=Erwinia citreus TaxID=558 RepID=UPI003C7704F8